MVVVVKSEKKSEKINIMEKNCPQISFFFSGRGDSDQKLPEKSDKMVPLLYNDDFRRKLVVFVVKKVKKQSNSRI